MQKRLCLWLILFAVFFQTSQAEIQKDFSVTVPAKGTHEILLPIAKWGRYSVRCKGKQSVSLTISDKRSGIIHRDGVVGERNARIDVLLDVGVYKLTVQGSDQASDSTQITAIPFTSPTHFQASVLQPMQSVHLELDDLQQVDYWFEVSSDTLIYIEAVGRNLASLVLWREGKWLMQTQNQSFESKLSPETPLAGQRFSIRLSKGTYRVSAYGGVSKEWALGGDVHPFWLQMGLETLAANVHSALVIPDRGYIQMLLANEISNLIVQASSKQRLDVEVQQLNAEFNRSGLIRRDSIYEKSSDTRLQMQVGSHSGPGYRVVKIWGVPGQAVSVLSFAPTKYNLGSQVASRYWVSTLHSGSTQDQVGASGALINKTDGSIVALSVDSISAQRELAKKFNLLGEINTYVWVDSDGKYSLIQGTSKYQWRIYRYYHKNPPNFRYPEFSSDNGTIDLLKGLHVLEIRPISKGVATLQIKPAQSEILNTLRGIIADQEKSTTLWQVPRSTMQFASVAVPAKASYALILNNQRPELAGISVRELPIDPDKPLGFWLLPGRPITISVKLQGPRLLEIQNAKGQSMAFSVDGKSNVQGQEVPAGVHTLSLTSASTEAEYYTLKTVLPQIPSSKALVWQNAPSKLPVLAAGDTVYTDLMHQGSRLYEVHIREAGFYRIETTGRLRTQIYLSDRFQHFRRSVSENGVGRNALMVEYLLPGEYQMTVQTQGQSAGHLGLTLFKNGLLDGGVLEANIDKRIYIEAYSGVEYSLPIQNEGVFRLESKGQNGDFPLRLEDSAGWPIGNAVSHHVREHSLSAGLYKLISLPTLQEGRRITRFTTVTPKMELVGKGPHTLTLNAPVSSVWIDSSTDLRTSAPVIFNLNVSAPISAKLNLSKGFQGKLSHKGKKEAILSWSGNKRIQLVRGDYQVTVLPTKAMSLVPYSLSVTTSDLIPGLTLQIRKPQTTRISLGQNSIVEIGSQGTLDVSATLYAEDAKTIIASNDDGYLDWNFSISRSLPAGRYFLRTESAEPRFTSTQIYMRALRDSVLDSLVMISGEARTVKRNMNHHLGILPLSFQDQGDVMSFQVQGKSNLGLSLEQFDVSRKLWASVAHANGLKPRIVIPRDLKNQYRLKVWAENNAADLLTISYELGASRYVNWDEISDGISGTERWLKVGLGDYAPGHFIVRSSKNTLTEVGVSTAINKPLLFENSRWFASNQPYAWIDLQWENPGKYQFKIEPWVLKAGSSFSMELLDAKPRAFHTQQSQNSLALLTVETDGANPLSGIAGNASASPLRVQGLALQSSLWKNVGVSATVFLAHDSARAIFWNSTPPADGAVVSAKIHWRELPILTGDTGFLAPGDWQWTSQGSSARKIRIKNSSPARLRLTLPISTGILIQHSNGSRELEFANQKSLVREFYVEGGEIYLFALQENSAISLVNFALSKQEILVTNPWHSMRKSEGSALLALKGDSTKSRQIYFQGALQEVDWISREGRLRANLKNGSWVGPGGFLRLNHQEGWSKIDLCDAKAPGGVMACKWGSSIVPNKVREFSQSSQWILHDSLNWFQISLKDTQHINLAVPQALSAILLQKGVPLHYQEAWENLNWDIPLSPGHYQLGIQSLAGSKLKGNALAVMMRHMDLLSEGSPFVGYLSPGESRLLAFRVAKKNDFGLGLKMNHETVQAVLLDSLGKAIHQGKQQFLKLNPGLYFVQLFVPMGLEGSEVTVHLFGQKPPPNVPPENLVQWILKGANGQRPTPDLSSEVIPDSEQPEWQRLLPQQENVRHYGEEEGGEYNSDYSEEGEQDGSENDYEGEGE